MTQFNAKEAQKLLKEVKEKKESLAKQEQENKKQKAIEEAKNYIDLFLEDVKKAISDEKDNIIKDVSNLDRLVINEIISEFNKLGFKVFYINKNKDEVKNSSIKISWSEEDKIETTDKDVKKLLDKLFDRHIDYFNYPFYRPYYITHPSFWL